MDLPAEHLDMDCPSESGPAFEPERLLDLLLAGCRDAAEAGERVAVMAYLMSGCHHRPRSHRELGQFLGCSHTAAADKVARVKAIFAEEFALQVAKGPIGDERFIC